MEVNLRAEFAADMPEDKPNWLVARYYAKTSTSWCGIVALIMALDEALGARRGGEYRILTLDMIRQVDKALGPVDWNVHEETEAPRRRRRPVAA